VDKGIFTMMVVRLLVLLGAVAVLVLAAGQATNTLAALLVLAVLD
jgi:hypothetical protein